MVSSDAVKSRTCSVVYELVDESQTETVFTPLYVRLYISIDGVSITHGIDTAYTPSDVPLAAALAARAAADAEEMQFESELALELLVLCVLLGVVLPAAGAVVASSETAFALLPLLLFAAVLGVLLGVVLVELAVVLAGLAAICASASTALL